MSKQEILEALLEAKKVYTRIIDMECGTLKVHEFYQEVRRCDLEGGFCLFFNKDKHVDYNLIINVLSVEAPVFITGELAYWYGTALTLYWYKGSPTIEAIKQQALQPRLDHLNRTIARLQEELNTATV